MYTASFQADAQQLLSCLRETAQADSTFLPPLAQALSSILGPSMFLLCESILTFPHGLPQWDILEIHSNLPALPFVHDMLFLKSDLVWQLNILNII